MARRAVVGPLALALVAALLLAAVAPASALRESGANDQQELSQMEARAGVKTRVLSSEQTESSSENGNEQVIDNANDDGTGTTVVLSNQNKVHSLNSKYEIAEQQSKQRVKAEADEKKGQLDLQQKHNEQQAKSASSQLAENGRALAAKLAAATTKLQESLKQQQELAARKLKAKLDADVAAIRAKAAEAKVKSEHSVKRLERRTAVRAEAHRQLEAAGGGGRPALEATFRADPKLEWALPSVYLVSGTVVHVEGLVWSTATQGHVATLPEPSFPRGGRLVFTALRNDRPARVDVMPDGRIFLVVGGPGSWLSLTGITYDARPDTPAPSLLYGWTPYLGEYRAPRQSRVGDLCLLSGLVKAGDWDKALLSLNPASGGSGCVPERRLVFGANHHETTMRLDLATDPRGSLVRVPGNGVAHQWVSLDGLAWPAGAGVPLSLASGWEAFGEGYGAPAYSMTEGLCVLSGVVKFSRGKWDNKARAILTLPAACRPEKRLVVAANADTATVRLDIFPSGSVEWVTPSLNNWVSLGGITLRTYSA